MEYRGNMSTKNISPSSVNDKNELKFDYSCSVGRLSPSSWDDSNEELSGEDSCSTLDRRQSLARVKRRKRGIRSPVLDRDSSDEFVVCSGPAVASSDLSPVHQSWNDSDSDEIISGIENYLNEKRLSLIRSKTGGNQSNTDECVSVFNGKVTNQTEILGGVDFRSNPDFKLSKIAEVEEEKSYGSLGNKENLRSAVPLCFQTNIKFADLTADTMTNFSNYDTPGVNHLDNRWVASIKSSPQNGVTCIADENNWLRIKSGVKRDNFGYTFTCEEAGHVSSSLNFIIDEKALEESTNNEEVGVRHGNVIYADDVKENESIISNLPDNVSSKETVDFGLENLFRTGARSGREAFLVQESSGEWNNPSITKRVRGNHTINSTKPKNFRNYLTETDHVLYFDGDWEKNRRGILLQEDNLRKKGDSSSGSKTERLNAGKHLNGRCSNDSEQSSNDSFRSKILLDLNLSDNDDKCSSVERTVFGDSPEDVNKLWRASNLENEAWSPSKDTPIANNPAVTEKPRGGTAEDFYKRNTQIHRCDCHQCGNGDSKWNSDEKMRRPNFPQDRGDMTFERPETEPSWNRLITNLERAHPGSRRPKETVFWLDINRQSQESKNLEIFRIKTLNGNTSVTNTKKTRTKPRKRKRESAGHRSCVESPNQWGRRLIDRRGNWLVNTVTRHEDLLTSSKRWFQALIVTRKRRRRPRGRKWHSCTKISNNDRKSIDCFCNLFKQIVNFFTVSRKCSK